MVNANLYRAESTKHCRLFSVLKLIRSGFIGLELFSPSPFNVLTMTKYRRDLMM